jgi:predicted nuclease of predicted toxin-antitoxin system
MKFLCDVHISRKIVNHLKMKGHQATHVNDILNKSETTDSDICQYADKNGLIVITKDADFRTSYFISQSPARVIKINLGNISTSDLIAIFDKNMRAIENLETERRFFLEMDKGDIIVVF